MPQANSRSITSKRVSRSPKRQTASPKTAQNLLPTALRGKKPISTVLIPSGLDPYAYALGCQGDCLAPLIVDGDTAVCSPSTKPEPGMIIAFSWKSGRQGSLKRLVSQLFGTNNGGNCQLLITVEMDNPWRQFFLDPGTIDKAHVVIGIVRQGKYISLTT